MTGQDRRTEKEKDVVAEIPTLNEKLNYEVYAAAVKDLIKSTNDASAATVTAAFSVATAYGALVALVTPTTRPTGLPLGLPFIGFILAALIALWGRGVGLKMSEDLGVSRISQLVDSHTKSKSKFLRTAIVVLALAVGASAWIVVENYSPAPAASTTPTTIHVIIDD